MSEGRPLLLLIGGGNEGLEVLEKAHELGLRVVSANRKDHFRESHAKYVEQAILTDYRDHERLVELARLVHRLWPLSGAISLSEAGLVPAAHVCEALGLSGNSVETVRLLKEKPLMRERLNGSALSPVAARIGGTRQDIEAFLREHGGPVIVKPTDGASSQGIFELRDQAQLDRDWTRIEALRLPRFLIEEYLDGPEISVESFSFHGRHVVVALTDKLTLADSHVEVGHSIPARLDPTTRAAVVELVGAVLDAVGLREGPAHTEIKLTRNGPRVIESHNRNGGDRINELVRLAFGFDLKATALAWACGRGEPPLEPPVAQGGAAIRFFVAPPGIVREITGTDAVRTSPGFVDLLLRVAPGDRVHPIRSSDDRCGYVIAQGATVDEAVSRCDALASQVRILTA